MGAAVEIAMRNWSQFGIPDECSIRASQSVRDEHLAISQLSRDLAEARPRAEHLEGYNCEHLEMKVAQSLRNEIECRSRLAAWLNAYVLELSAAIIEDAQQAPQGVAFDMAIRIERQVLLNRIEVATSDARSNATMIDFAIHMLAHIWSGV